MVELQQGVNVQVFSYSYGLGVQPAGKHHLTVKGIDGSSVVSLPSMAIGY